MEYYRDGRRQVYGICASIIDNITASLNMTYDAIAPVDLEWGVVKPDGTYTGMLRDASTKKVDIGFGPFTMEESLRKDFLLSDIFGHFEIGITSGVRDSPEINLGLLRAFDIPTWICLLVSVLVLDLTIPALKHLSGSNQGTAQNRRPTVGMFLWPLVTALLGQGTVKLQTKRVPRPISGAWVLACLVVSTYFTSLIVATLTTRTSFAKIDTAEDLFKRRHMIPMYPAGTQLGVVLQTSALEEYRHLYAMSVKHRSAREVPNLYRPEDIDAILKHKAVIIIAKASAKYRLKDVCLHSQARFYVSRGYLILWNSVFVANKDFPPDLFKELNKRVKWWVQSGVPSLHPYELEPPGGACFASSGSSQREEGPYASNTLRFQDLTMLFFTFLGSLALALVVLILELGANLCRDSWRDLRRNFSCCARYSGGDV